VHADLPDAARRGYAAAIEGDDYPPQQEWDRLPMWLREHWQKVARAILDEKADPVLAGCGSRQRTEGVPDRTRQTSAKAKREAQAQGARYGCFVDLAPDGQPDGCVKDSGTDTGCIHARRHSTREGCRYWQPVESANTGS
jgi:hypothetical protein